MDALLFGGASMLLFTVYPYCAMISHFLWASRPTPLQNRGRNFVRSKRCPTYMSRTASTYFLRLNNSETFVELVGARPLHLLSQTVLPLKSPTGAFIAALRFANAVYAF